MSDLIVWIDVETTGLNVNVDEIAEVGVVVTRGLYEEAGRGRWILGHDKLVRRLEKADEFVQDMHKESGLWDDVMFLSENQAGYVRPKDVEQKVLRFLKALGVEPGTSPMAGSSVGFDRSFLAKFTPELERFFHYRNLDISSIKEFARSVAPEVKWKPPGKKVHRTLEDLDSTLDEARFYNETFFARGNAS